LQASCKAQAERMLNRAFMQGSGNYLAKTLQSRCSRSYVPNGMSWLSGVTRPVNGR
jgi:hypothetical protein